MVKILIRLIRKEGKAAFEKRIATALSLSSFFFQTLSRQSDMNTMEGRRVLPLLPLTILNNYLTASSKAYY